MWAKIFPNGNIYLIEEPGSKAVAKKETLCDTVKVSEAMKWAKEQGAGTFAVAAVGEVEPIVAPPKPANGVDLKVPFYPQLDNPESPGGTCNVTSVAMVLGYKGIKPKKAGEQLEMEVKHWLEDNGLDRHVHDHLAKAFRAYGVQDRFTTEATLKDIKAHLEKGFPCVVSGMFTSSGHIVCITGYDSTGFWVNDPYGEYFADGYAKEPVASRGKHQHYSFDLIKRVSGGDGSIWCHFPSW